MSAKLYGLLGVNLAVVAGGAAQRGLFGRAEWVVPEDCEKLVRHRHAITTQFYYEEWGIVRFSPLIDEDPEYGWKRAWSPRFLRPVDLKGKVVPVTDEVGLLSPRQ